MHVRFITLNNKYKQMGWVKPTLFVVFVPQQKAEFSHERAVAGWSSWHNIKRFKSEFGKYPYLFSGSLGNEHTHNQ